MYLPFMLPAGLSFWVHVLGFATGIVLYAMLAMMVWQDRNVTRWPGQPLSTTPRKPYTLLIAASLGLVLSILINTLHLKTFLDPAASVPHIATGFIVVGYAVLLTLIAIHMWRLTAVQRALSLIAIAVFAVSAAHIFLYRSHVESLPVELIVHYAPLPLVAALLYQEYRFALADVFLKRALALITLVIMIAIAYGLAQAIGSNVALMALWIATALAYPVLRDGIYHLVDRIVLRRTTSRTVRLQLATAVNTENRIDVVLDRACRILQQALTAKWITWLDASETREMTHAPSVRILVPTAENPQYVIAIGALANGRRLLSGDMSLAEMVALDVARRIDNIRITEERYERTIREGEIIHLATEAELRALQAQLNPHFLFNAMTTIGYLIQSAPDRALTTLLRLTDLLRAVLRRTSGSLVTVREELSLVEAYLAIEQERFEERLHTRLDLQEAVSHWKIPPLLIQPLVENAIKHGIGPLSEGGLVRISVSSIDARDGSEYLWICVEDTGAGTTTPSLRRGQQQGVGLSNIEQRMRRYYDNDATLTISSAAGQGTVVHVILPRTGE